MTAFDETMELCTKLGQAIAQTEAYKDFKKAEYALFKNPEAVELVEDLQKLKQSQYRKQMAGEELTQEDMEEMKVMEAKCLHNNLVLESNNAQMRYQKFMEEVSGMIREGIKSVDDSF